MVGDVPGGFIASDSVYGGPERANRDWFSDRGLLTFFLFFAKDIMIVAVRGDFGEGGVVGGLVPGSDTSACRSSTSHENRI